jgi:predicted dienelactone hydrolase
MSVMFLSLIVSYANAQIDYEIGKKNIALVDSARNYRNVDMKVFYPADVAGTNVPIATSLNKKFPVIVFGHAQQIQIQNYHYLVDFYVPRGFILAFPKTENGANPNHLDFAKDMVFVIDEFEEMHTDPASTFYGRYNFKSCVSGHGMGGGSAYLAAEMDQDITMSFTFGASETTPSAIAATQNIVNPALVIAGGKDCVAPASGNQEAMFNSLGSSCKVLINQLEATHCQFAQDNKKCTKAQIGCPASSYSSDSTNTYTNMLSISFLRYYLKYNVNAWPLFIQKMTTFGDVVYVNNCFAPSQPRTNREIGEADGNIYNFNVYPNPSILGTDLMVVIDAIDDIEATVTIVNTLGQQIFSKNYTMNSNNNVVSIATGDLAPGNYIITVTDGLSQKLSKPMIIK